MEIIIHRVNSIIKLKKVESKYGAEIDIRSQGSNLILNHEPFFNGDKLIDYLDEYNHGTLILNIKEQGIEDEVLRLIRKRSQIKSYFLLDVEFPYIFNSSRNGEKDIAIRFSEDESIETVKKYINKVNWVWLDTFTEFPIKEKNIKVLNNFKQCLVCPERWGRSYDIKNYKYLMSRLSIEVDAVMTSSKNISDWT